MDKIIVRIAQNKDEIKDSQRLRYQVFFEEMGAQKQNINSPINPIQQNENLVLDIDEYDDYCEHLIAIETTTNKVIGSYRMLSPANAQKIGRWYSASEFNLKPLENIFPQMVEVGRSCVMEGYRNGAIIAKLWSGIVHYLLQGNYKYLIGCACVPLNIGEKAVRQIINQSQKHLAPNHFQVHPLKAWGVDNINPQDFDPQIKMPPLLKGYLRAGAWICGAPAHDPIFNTADLLILLSLTQIENRHFQHFVNRQKV